VFYKDVCDIDLVNYDYRGEGILAAAIQFYCNRFKKQKFNLISMLTPRIKCFLCKQKIQHYVIKFVSHLRQVNSFLWVLPFPPPIKLTTMI